MTAMQSVQLGEREHADETHTCTPRTHLAVHWSHRMREAEVRGGNIVVVVVGGAKEQMKDKVKHL